MSDVDLDKKIESAEASLARHLDWIGRYDTKIAFTVGIILTMLGVLATAAGNIKTWNCLEIFAVVTATLLLFLSLVLVYLNQYPRTDSPNSSLIYFGTIGNLKFSDFKKEYEEASRLAYLEDVLSQIHINAVILKKKFDSLKTILLLAATAILPWLTVLYLSKMYIK